MQIFKKSDQNKAEKLGSDWREAYLRYEALNMNERDFNNLAALINEDGKLKDLVVNAASCVIVDGRDSPEGYGGTSILYDSRRGLIIHDWVGMDGIPDHEANEGVTHESMARYLPRFTPSLLKNSILAYIEREGHWAKWIPLDQFISQVSSSH